MNKMCSEGHAKLSHLNNRIIVFNFGKNNIFGKYINSGEH